MTEKPTAFQVRDDTHVKYIAVTISEKGTVEIWPIADDRERTLITRMMKDGLKAVFEILDQDGKQTELRTVANWE